MLRQIFSVDWKVFVGFRVLGFRVWGLLFRVYKDLPIDRKNLSKHVFFVDRT